MSETVGIPLTVEDTAWALDNAKTSIKKWSERDGYYNNRLASHITGKLGELAVEKYLLEQGYKLDSHFRFPERENLSDIVVKVWGYSRIRRLEVKTWSESYWAELGRCIAVEQYPILKRKADIVIWCLVDHEFVERLVKKPGPGAVSLAGWSVIGRISEAPIHDTGTGNMRKVRNYQLREDDLHPIQTIAAEGLSF
jgi:hypothetical protein